MALVPVGESLVSISINGTERVNELISDDTSYDLTEQFNTNISVNGTTEGNFTQANDSVYDVSVSSNPRVRRQGSAGGGTSFQIVKTGGDIIIDKIDWYLDVVAGAGSGGFAELNSENGREELVNGGSTQSGTIQDPNFNNLDLYVDGQTSSVNYDIEVYLNGIDANLNVNSVNKQ